jgi:hypothetical protein
MADGRDIIIVHTSDVHVDNDYTARAHGGEDHGAPAAAAVVSPDGLRAPLSSASLDAVLVLPPAPAAVAQSAPKVRRDFVRVCLSVTVSTY